MCFNFEVSISAWYVALFSSFVIFYFSSRLDKRIKYIWYGTFLLTFSQIQIIEAIIWATNDKNINNICTILIYYLLWLQPLINCIGLLIYKLSEKKITRYTILIYVVPILYYISTIIYSLFFLDTVSYISYPGHDNHLVWNNCRTNNCNYFLNIFKVKNNILNSLIGISYMVGLILPPMLTYEYDGIILTIYSITSYIISKILFMNNEYASIWCFIAIGYGIVCIISICIENIKSLMK